MIIAVRQCLLLHCLHPNERQLFLESFEWLRADLQLHALILWPATASMLFVSKPCVEAA
jgi:hypothetical protein